MKLAASNIAWLPEADARVAEMLTATGFTGVEIAPTRYWSDPSTVSLSEAESVRQFWADRNLPVVALQSLLFARPQSALFASTDERAALQRYLTNIVSLGGALGARVLVFGSPRNRRREALPMQQAVELAIPFFRTLGDVAAQANVVIGIEPNPAAYHCDFITNTREGIDLVKRIDHEAVQLHLDAGALAINGEDPAAAVLEASPHLCHVHCSEANLQPIGAGQFLHAAFADALRQNSYTKWVSVEMRAPEGPGRDATLLASLETAAKAYHA